MLKRIGVFVCWCGLNIGEIVDVKKVASLASRVSGVEYATDYKYMCSDPGQGLIVEAIKTHNLDGIIIAACSPNMHEATFRKTVEAAGINGYRCEIANIREQCSWVHRGDKAEATRKAIQIVLSAIAKLKRNEALQPIEIPITKRALVVGGGIAGMQAALDIADGGYEVVLVEKNPYIGGHMAQLSETFPTLDCSQCILTPRTAEVGRHPRIKLHTHSQVIEIEGYVGNFTVKIRKNPTYVDWEKCTGCGLCAEKCPKPVLSEFDKGLTKRKAIYIAFPQAVPYRPVIDAENCTYMVKNGKCGLCARVCQVEAIRFDDKETVVEEKVGAIVVATGYRTLPMSEIGEYGYGKYPDVVDGLMFERLNSASGPTSGEIRRPSDGRVPKNIVFIQCVGSRDPENGRGYCSKVCCMYTAKHARLYKHKVPNGKATIFYIDIRAAGKGYEEFVQDATEEENLLYLRGRVSRVVQDNGQLEVWGVDTLSNRQVRMKADMVVLSTAIVPASDSSELARIAKVGTDSYGFLSEAHPKLRPVETLTRGVYIAGCVQSPKDIPDTVSQASAAASKVQTLLSNEHLYHPPTVVTVSEDLCKGCGACVAACPYGARSIDDFRSIAVVNPVLCQGCGTCAMVCPNGATELRNSTRAQIGEMIDAILRE